MATRLGRTLLPGALHHSRSKDKVSEIKIIETELKIKVNISKSLTEDFISF